MEVHTFLPSTTTVCSIYLLHTEKIDKNQLTNLLQWLPVQLILLGDFNAYSPQWSCQWMDCRWHDLEDCINKLNSAVLSTFSPANLHFDYRTRSTRSAYFQNLQCGNFPKNEVTIVSERFLPPEYSGNTGFYQKPH